jgi:hypothetical protein
MVIACYLEKTLPTPTRTDSEGRTVENTQTRYTWSLRNVLGLGVTMLLSSAKILIPVRDDISETDNLRCHRRDR